MSVRFSGIETYHILDTERSAQFDQLTQLVAKICKGDAAFISFFDGDRQWFKSKIGFDYNEVQFSNSICQHFVSENLSHLNISDLSRDDVFKNHPVFIDHGVRFFAGFPLLSPDKSILGSFCVFGNEPQILDDLQLEFLKTMTDQAMILINVHKLNHDLSVETQGLEKRRLVTNKAAIIGKLGGLYLDMNRKDIFWTPSNNILFDLELNYSMSFEEFESGNFEFTNSSLSIFEKIREICIKSYKLESKFSFDHEAEERMIEVHGELIQNELYVTFQNKSDHNKLTRELRFYKTLMEQVEEMVNLGGWSYDLKSKEIFLTKNTYSICDLPVGQKITLRQAMRFFPSENFDEMKVDFTNFSETAKSYQKEYLFSSKTGRTKWVKTSFYPVFKEDKIVQLVGSLQDITGEKKLRAKLQKSKRKAVQTANYYKSLVNNPTFYICKTRIDGVLTFYNDLYADELEAESFNGEKVGLDFFHSVKPEYMDFAKEAFFSVASGVESKRRVLLKEINSDQLEVTNLWDFIGLKNSQEKLSEVLCLGYDVSELEENKNQVQLLADYTAFQNKKILEYNSIVSHDIRSHVANSVGLINLMELINEEDEYNEYFMMLKKEIKKTDRTIMTLDKLTSISSIFESGREPVSLYDLIEHVFDLLKRNKPNARFIKRNKIPKDLIIFSIREYLENVFLNVLSNSLKLISPERELQIEIDALQITSSILQIKIMDNGIGIDIKDRGEGIFKIKRPLKEIQYGNGVGLYLVKQQIEALGGHVNIQSNLGKGTTIILEFTKHEN